MRTRTEAPVEGYVLTHDTEHLAGKAVVKGRVVIVYAKSGMQLILHPL